MLIGSKARLGLKMPEINDLYTYLYLYAYFEK